MGLFRPDKPPRSLPSRPPARASTLDAFFTTLKTLGFAGEPVRVTFEEGGGLVQVVGYVRRVSKSQDQVILYRGNEPLMYLPLSAVRNVAAARRDYPNPRPPRQGGQITSGPVGKEIEGNSQGGTVAPDSWIPPQGGVPATRSPAPYAPTKRYPDHPDDMQGDDPHTRAARRDWDRVKAEQDALDEQEKRRKNSERPLARWEKERMDQEYEEMCQRRREQQRIEADQLREAYKLKNKDWDGRYVPLWPEDPDLAEYRKHLARGGTEHTWKFPLGKHSDGRRVRPGEEPT